MASNFTYKFERNNGILYKYYYGIITLNDIITSWQFAFQNNIIPPDVSGFILDYREAHFEIAIDENKKIADFYKAHPLIFGNFKFAIITTDPKDVVVPILVAFDDDGYYSKPFCTVEAALTWILG